jgi:hypothetical protein
LILLFINIDIHSEIAYYDTYTRLGSSR